MKKSIRVGEGIAEFFGTHDGNVKYLESLLNVQVHLQGRTKRSHSSIASFPITFNFALKAFASRMAISSRSSASFRKTKARACAE